MGAWGTGSFDNDAAVDWLLSDFKRKGVRAIKSEFKSVMALSKADDLNPFDAYPAVAAAELVAAAHDGDTSRLPGGSPDASAGEDSAFIAALSGAADAAAPSSFAKHKQAIKAANLRALARQAVEKTLEVSERATWRNPGSADRWANNLRVLLSRLETP